MVLDLCANILSCLSVFLGNVLFFESHFAATTHTQKSPTTAELFFNVSPEALTLF